MPLTEMMHQRVKGCKAACCRSLRLCHAACAQGLRIAVNEELSALKAAIPQAISLLNPGGRLAIISFHSLEDRIAKRELLAAAGQAQETAPVDLNLQAFMEHQPQPVLVEIVTRKPIKASEAEMGDNPRSRSAKLRVAQKL